ncbi:MAG TPA: hypothetical protein VJ876_02765, partial [Bacteroidales bacterium]|nr:hypothetical protein [Bacteroidales bacterium]
GSGKHLSTQQYSTKAEGFDGSSENGNRSQDASQTDPLKQYAAMNNGKNGDLRRMPSNKGDDEFTDY